MRKEGLGVVRPSIPNIRDKFRILSNLSIKRSTGKYTQVYRCNQYCDLLFQGLPVTGYRHGSCDRHVFSLSTD